MNEYGILTYGSSPLGQGIYFYRESGVTKFPGRADGLEKVTQVLNNLNLDGWDVVSSTVYATGVGYSYTWTLKRFIKK